MVEAPRLQGASHPRSLRDLRGSLSSGAQPADRPTRRAVVRSHARAEAPQASRGAAPQALRRTGRHRRLAACAAIDLSKQGYVVPASSVLQAPPGSTAAGAEIFYRDAQGKADAQVLATHYFKNEQSKVRHLQSSAGIPKGAELAVFLGSQ